MITNCKKSIFLISFVFITGCQENDGSIEITDKKAKTTKEVSEPLSNSKLKKSPDIQKKPTTKSIVNNGEKISYESDKLTRGTIVYNHFRAKQGIVTGAVYLTLSSNNIPQEIERLYNTKKIEQHTYKFLVPNNSDLVMITNDLKQYNSVKIIEIAVNYSPRNEQF